METSRGEHPNAAAFVACAPLMLEENGHYNSSQEGCYIITRALYSYRNRLMLPQETPLLYYNSKKCSVLTAHTHC